jgi:hypothetical protein
VSRRLREPVVFEAYAECDPRPSLPGVWSGAKRLVQQPDYWRCSSYHLCRKGHLTDGRGDAAGGRLRIVKRLPTP